MTTAGPVVDVVGVEPGRDRRWPVLAVSVAGSLSLLAVLCGWRGADLAAQVFRADLFRDHGFVLWNNLWFGGHATLDYSVLTPVLGAIMGPLAVAVVTSMVSAFLVDRLLRAHFGSSAAAGVLFFATSTVTNLAVGRVAFFLGVMFGLGALLGLQRRRPWPASASALLCSLASPVAGVFLIVATVAWGSRRRARWSVMASVLAATVAPLALVAVLFPTGGVFPFEGKLLAETLLACLAVVVVLPRKQAVLRWATMLYALACVVDFVVANPLGGNITRLAQYGAGPILACVLWPARRRLLVAVAVPLLVWQWYPAFDGIALAGRDESTSVSYYAPLLAFLRSQPGGPSRIEIPVTDHHWESVYVGDTQSLARGWERQLDMSFNPLFYDGTLNATSYQQWLSSLGVRYVALARAPLDSSAVAEAQLLDGGLPYLVPVWRSNDWQVWRYDASPGLISGPATLVQIAPDSFTVNVSGPGDVVVRVRASAHWAVPAPGCAAADPDGWTLLRHLPVGSTRVTQALGADPCP
ncbi:MAG: hypothetical protein QOD57_1123 [Actinomycetota bacterium]|jgi:hypothetical protein|nr:hypothetical protein [Actinomycetota bacterium]